MYFRIRNISLIVLVLVLITALIYAGPTAQVPSPATDTDASTQAAPVETAAVVVLTEPAAIPMTYTVSLDVNPSIELVVTDGLVATVGTFNDDGQQVTLAVNVVGLTPEEAIRLLVGEMITQNFIVQSEDEPYLIITVSNGDQLVLEDAAELLEKAAEEVLEQQSIDCKVRSAYVPDSLTVEAEALSLSTGRYIVMQVAAETEGLKLEETITLYGTMKINSLMKQFPEAKDAFKDYNKSMEMDEDEEKSEDIDGMTPEQAALFQAALNVYHREIKDAKAAFFLARDMIKADLKSSLETLEKPGGQDKEGKDEYKVTVEALREAAKEARHQAIDTMKAAIKAAQEKFKTAKADLGLADFDEDELLDEDAEFEEDDFDIGDFIDSEIDDDDDDDDDEDDDDDDEDD